MSEHDVEMRAIFRTIADEARLPVEAEHKLMSAARRKRKLTAAMGALSLFVAIGAIAAGAMLWDPSAAPSPDTEIGGPGAQGVPVRFDQMSGECVGDQGASLNECKAELSRVMTALKNAATAEESFATTTVDGSYTERFSDLEAEGFEKPADLSMNLFGPTVGDAFYCIEAYSEKLRGTLHYSSMVGSPEPGPCFAELETTLKNAATAEEAYFTDQVRYTEEVSDLEEKGLKVPDGIELTIMVAGGQYCIEAVSVDAPATLHYTRNGDGPEPGPCPRDKTG